MPVIVQILLTAALSAAFTAVVISMMVRKFIRQMEKAELENTIREILNEDQSEK